MSDPFAVTLLTWDALRAAHEPRGDVWKMMENGGFRQACEHGRSVGTFL